MISKIIIASLLFQVSNFVLEKHVFLRMTCDGWKTFVDHAATYQASALNTSSFDVFKFDLEMPKLQNALEQQQQVLVFHIHIQI